VAKSQAARSANVLEPEVRELFVDWDETTARAVACLRSVIGGAIDDPRIVELVGELSLRSDRFRSLRARHDVRQKTSGVTRLRHPQAGPLDLRYEKPGTSSAECLQLLAHLAADYERTESI
jgi:hypothetical protein